MYEKTRMCQFWYFLPKTIKIPVSVPLSQDGSHKKKKMDRRDVFPLIIENREKETLTCKTRKYFSFSVSPLLRLLKYNLW